MTVAPLYHVLIVNHSSDNGGADFSLEALVASMPSARCSYTIALPVPGPSVNRLRARGLEVRIVPLESWRWWVDTGTHVLKFFLTLPFQLLSLLRWLRFLRQLHPDIVHFNINRLTEPVLAARMLRIPSVMHFRDIPSRVTHRFVLGWRGFYAIMNMADCWIANSSATDQDIAPHARHPVKVIPNAMDLVDFDRTASRCERGGSMGGSLIVAMVALLVPWKNHATYIEVTKQVARSRDDVVFLIAGAGDPEYTFQLKQLARDLGVAEKVKFLGHVDNVPGFLLNIDLLVHTTDREPFGRVFIEAMAASKPVVAFDSGGAAEIVANGETGFLIPTGDIEAMASAVCRLLDDPALRQRMGEAGRRRVEERYTIQRHVDSVFQVYQEILEQPSSK